MVNPPSNTPEIGSILTLNFVISSDLVHMLTIFDEARTIRSVSMISVNLCQHYLCLNSFHKQFLLDTHFFRKHQNRATQHPARQEMEHVRAQPGAGAIRIRETEVSGGK